MSPDETGGTTLRHWRSEGALVLHDPELMPEPSLQFFQPGFWKTTGRLRSTEKGRGTTYLVSTPQGGDWVLRHLWRGGLPAMFVRDRFIWTGPATARPFRELQMLARLRERGLPVPRPVAGMVRRQGPFYRADILTGKVPGRPLSHTLREGEADTSTWRRLGEVLRAFHDQGVYHADLSVGNILLDRGAVHLIDFDRGRVRPLGRWQARNLARLHRSASKLLGENEWRSRPWRECWEALEAGYASGEP
ncbi:MAG: 3-deoxy-D-manno-octulosonic acid kinase [Gemmatimonadota bacterium]